MKSSIKRIIASAMALSSLTVGIIGMSTNAADTTYWKNSTSGNLTTRSKYTTSSIVNNPQSTSLSLITATMSHTISNSNVNSWTVTATNLATTSKYMYARNYATNRATSAIIWDTYTGNNASIPSGHNVYSTTSANYSDLPTYYTLWYESETSTGGEQQSPLVQQIILEERLSK